ncbi:MAG: CapA family protein [Deltaproteobacteria bacterium]|nr:CapA family protein [Deltaproteobacteria bacterium]MBZ0219117.1 CapA family protein [Deltaproteobacteria bacterium]
MKVLFVGDVMLGRLVNRELGRRRPEYPWGDTLPVFKGSDARIINLECVISDRGEPWSITHKAFHFRTDSKNISVLRAAGIDAVSIANNHSLDYGFGALVDMLDALDAAGIKRAGAGRNLEEAASPAFFEVNGKWCALMAFTDNEPEWEAGPESPGVYYVPVDVDDSRAEALFERVRDARKKADFLVVSAHWGPNWGYRPRPNHRPFGRKLLEIGAHLVFGHSCHVFQGIEFHHGGALIYSSGNFIDDYAVDEAERNDESFIFTTDFDGRVRSIELRPTVIDEFSAHMAASPRAELIAAKMKNLCGEMGSVAEWDEEMGALKVVPR